ncbi:hypothetical protein HY214_04675 [Candidatus Roizmanbacteria bacterium]|nr:hypothetical protein [Candidatus Roizmanbacteria bacterium]
MSLATSEGFGQEAFRKIGVNSFTQAERAQKLMSSLGPVGYDIAAKEHEANEQGYRREFIVDEPLSLPHFYYCFQNELYSYPVKHDLVKISPSIHPGERDGRTLAGFKRFEETTFSPGNQVTLWYSPAGKAGQTPPFDTISFDSGRLYFNFKTNGNESVNLDLKVKEDDFPIDRILNYLSGTPEKSPDLFYYLDHPIGFSQEAGDFLSFLEHAAEAVGIPDDLPIYVARRNDADRQTHTWGQVVKQLREFLTRAVDKTVKIQLPLTPVLAADLTSAETIEERIYGMMHQFMQQTGRRTLSLYGCSATSIFNLEDLINPGAKIITAGLDLSGPPNIFATVYRLENNRSEEFVCPNCRKASPPPVGDNCPKCGISKDAAKEKGMKTC